MTDIISRMSGVGVSSTPLVAFDTIVDTDLSLVLYCIKNFRNYDVFRLDEIRKNSVVDIIKALYFRSYRNPLYFLAIDESKYEFLDECYKEFMETEEFLSDKAITTDMYDLVEQFLNSGEIATTILYRSEQEKKIIDNDKLLSKLGSVSIDEVDMDFYTQIYLRYLEDIIPIKKLMNRAVYISSMSLNMNDDSTDLRDDGEKDIVRDLAILHNEVSVFSLYREKVIGRSIF